jgi:hypothetical protein
MHKMDRDRPLANGRRNPLNVSGADVANRENCRQACLEHLRRPVKRPSLWSACQNWIQVPSCKNEALRIKRDTATQPVATRRRTRHHEDVPDIARHALPRRPVEPGDPFKVRLAL